MIFYVINLARASKRWKSISCLGSERRIRMERIEAVDGRAQGTLAGTGHQPMPSSRHVLRPTEVACFESHKLAWKKIAGGTDAFGVVLEDDVFLSAETAEVVSEIVRERPSLALVKLNASSKRVLLRKTPAAKIDGRQLKEICKRTVDASSYIISRDYARQALCRNKYFREPVDRVLFDPKYCPDILQIVPAITVQAKHANFQFLDLDVELTSVQIGPYSRRLEKRRFAVKESIRKKIDREMSRFKWRWIMPFALPAINAFRSDEDHLVWEPVPFLDSRL